MRSGPVTRSDKLLATGVLLVVIGVPLMFVPMVRSSFATPKLWLLTIAGLLVWLSRRRWDRTFTALGAVWLAEIAVASALGVDPWLSLVGFPNQEVGLLAFAVTVPLIGVAPTLPSGLRDRIAPWLVAAGALVALVAIPGQLIADLTVPPGLALDGSTVGQRVVVGALVAAAAVALVGLGQVRAPWLIGLALLFGTALSLSQNRTAIIALLAGGLVAATKLRPGRRHLAMVSIPLIAALALWAGLDRMVAQEGSPEKPLSPAGRFAHLDKGSAALRAPLITGGIRAFVDRPVTGWGPGNTAGAWLSHATEAEVAKTNEKVGDTHNLIVETAVTQGLLGLLALGAILVVGVLRHLKAPRELGWASGAATALAVYHLFQPLALSVTPLLFFLLALPPGPRSLKAARPWHQATGAVALAGLFLLATNHMVTDALVAFDQIYFSQPALKTALALEPRNPTVAARLSLSWALDGRGGDEEAGVRATQLSSHMVHQHPWYPDARLTAADVATLLNDEARVDLWLRRQRAAFPADPRLPQS